MNARNAISGVGQVIVETHNVELGPEVVGQNTDVATGSYVMVAVRDTGAGISPEIIPRVFDPFFTTKGVGEGAGLGLSQVYGFTKESDGHIEIDSTVGAGTTVRLYLPVSPDAAVDTASGGRTTSGRTASSPVTVLVVEDDKLVLALVTDILREFGFRLLTAQDASDALVVLKGPEPVDILFSDVVMPGDMNGVQLANEARRLRPHIKVLLTSGYPATMLATQHGLENRMPLLGKPYRAEQLVDKFRVILDGP
jgi:CheY-like chemotaxis protein